MIYINKRKNLIHHQKILRQVVNKTLQIKNLTFDPDYIIYISMSNW